MEITILDTEVFADKETSKVIQVTQEETGWGETNKVKVQTNFEEIDRQLSELNSQKAMIQLKIDYWTEIKTLAESKVEV